MGLSSKLGTTIPLRSDEPLIDALFQLTNATLVLSPEVEMTEQERTIHENIVSQADAGAQSNEVVMNRGRN